MNKLELYQMNGESGSALHGGTQHHDILELEQLVAQQREKLSAAVQYLHEAAYLARYHQPALERDIRAFLNQIES